MLLANPSREVAWRRIVYLGMQLIHRQTKNKICFVKAWWIWENVYLNTSSSPKVAYFSDPPFRTVVNFRNCFPTSWQPWYTTSPLSFFFFFFLTHQTCEFATFFFLSLSLVEIESRCCRKIEIEICSIARTLKIKFYVLSVLRIAGCFAIFKKNTNNNIMDNLVLINCLYQKK